MDQSNPLERASAFTTWGGIGTAVGSGVSVKVTEIWGFTTDQWQLIGIIGGLGVGFFAALLNAGIAAYFNWRRLQLELEKMEERNRDCP